MCKIHYDSFKKNNPVACSKANEHILQNGPSGHEMEQKSGCSFHLHRKPVLPDSNETVLSITLVIGKGS